MMKLLSIGSIACLTTIVISCSSMEGPELISLTPEETVSQVILESDFIMMQVGDTHSVNFEVKNINKSAIPVVPEEISWISQDTSQLEVDENGLLKAKIANSLPIRIIVSYKKNFNTVRDTVHVYITPNKLAGAGIRLVIIDSNKVGSEPAQLNLGYPRLRVDIVDEANIVVTKGSTIPISTPLPVTSQFVSAGGNDKEPIYVIKNDRGFLGKFWVRSSVNLYGTRVSDSIQFVGIAPVASFALNHFVITDGNGFVIPVIKDTTERIPQLQTCGAIVVSNLTLGPIDVVFSDSLSTGICDSLPSSLSGEKVLGGNVLNLPRFSRGIRRIGTAGVVHYYLRDAITKERLPVSGQYESVQYTETE